MSYSKEFIEFVATINGEAGGCSATTWKVIAHCIKNRLGFAEWVEAKNIQSYLEKDFDALTDQTLPVRKVISEMTSGKISKHTQDIIDAVSPIYNDIEEDFTNGVVLYFSPKAQAQFHKENPSKYKKVPDFVNSRTEVVKIKGTENDDMEWYRLKGTSRFYVQFVDSAASPLIGSKVNISYKKTKKVPTLSNLIINEQGKIKSFLVADGWGARFTVDGIQVKDELDKEVMLIADGKNHSAVIVVNNRKGGIKSKTDIHNQQVTPSQKQESIKIDNKAEVDNKKKLEVGASNTTQKNINFSIKIVDSENKIIPNFSYFLKYKNTEKQHNVGANGIENNLIALSGEEITVLISGLDSKQEIICFTAQEGMGEKTIKFNLHTFNILFRHRDTKKPITNLNLIQKYRNQIKQKKTDGNGKITVRAMPGFELNYKLRDERNLLTIKVDKNKSLRIIDVDTSAIEEASKNIKTGSKILEIPQSEQKTPPSKHKQPIETHDSTPKRDENIAVSKDGHPKTVINDSREVEFTVLTYDIKTNQLFNGGNYIVEYKDKKRNHVSGANGLGKKIHKGVINESIRIIVLESNKEKIIFDGKIENSMATINLKIPKAEVAKVEGVSVLFSGVNEEWRRNIISEKTKKILAYLAKEAGMNKIYITSTIRTAESQANAMYGQNIRYTAPGEAVKRVRDECKAKNMTKEQTISKMVEKIIELQKQNKKVSKHCVSTEQYNKINVVDIGLNSNGFGTNNYLNAQGKKFKQACKDAKLNGIISGFISGDEPGEGAMHIEITQ